MHNLLAQLPALVGVGVGVLGTLLVTTTTDLARWKRDQSVRWDERRLDAYAEYSQAIKELHAIALGMTQTRISDNIARPIDRNVGLEMLAQAEARRTRIWESMLFLGDAGTVSAAGDWSLAVWRVERLARDLTDHDKSAEWFAAVRSADEARDRFYSTARQSINVRGGPVTQAPQLPSAESSIQPM